MPSRSVVFPRALVGIVGGILQPLSPPSGRSVFPYNGGVIVRPCPYPTLPFFHQWGGVRSEVPEITGKPTSDNSHYVQWPGLSGAEGRGGPPKVGPVIVNIIGITNPGNIPIPLKNRETSVLLSPHGPYRQEARSPPSTVSGPHDTEGSGQGRCWPGYAMEVDQGA